MIDKKSNERKVRYKLLDIEVSVNKRPALLVFNAIFFILILLSYFHNDFQIGVLLFACAYFGFSFVAIVALFLELFKGRFFKICKFFFRIRYDITLTLIIGILVTVVYINIFFLNKQETKFQKDYEQQLSAALDDINLERPSNFVFDLPDVNAELFSIESTARKGVIVVDYDKTVRNEYWMLPERLKATPNNIEIIIAFYPLDPTIEKIPGSDFTVYRRLGGHETKSPKFKAYYRTNWLVKIFYAREEGIIAWRIFTSVPGKVTMPMEKWDYLHLPMDWTDTPPMFWDWLGIKWEKPKKELTTFWQFFGIRK